MINARKNVQKMCELLQPLTQNNVITPERAGMVVSELCRGNKGPVEEIVNSRDIPMMFLPIVKQIKEELRND